MVYFALSAVLIILLVATIHFAYLECIRMRNEARKIDAERKQWRDASAP